MKFNYLLLPKKGNQLPLEKRNSENNMKTKVTSYRAIHRKKTNSITRVTSYRAKQNQKYQQHDKGN